MNFAGRPLHAIDHDAIGRGVEVRDCRAHEPPAPESRIRATPASAPRAIGAAGRLLVLVDQPDEAISDFDLERLDQLDDANVELFSFGRLCRRSGAVFSALAGRWRYNHQPVPPSTAREDQERTDAACLERCRTGRRCRRRSTRLSEKLRAAPRPRGQYRGRSRRG